VYLDDVEFVVVLGNVGLVEHRVVDDVAHLEHVLRGSPGHVLVYRRAALNDDFLL
jgi:hypothetical protein